MDIKERLAESLKKIDLDDPIIRVVPGDHHRVVGIIVSPTFEGKDEAERQDIVWDRVLKDLDDQDQSRIEFLYTDTPSERPIERLASEVR